MEIPTSRSERRFNLAAFVLIALHASLAGFGGCANSPTIDEPAHLAAGVSHWRFGRFDLYKVNPPLSRIVASLPVLWMQFKEDWSGYDAAPGSRAEFRVGQDFAISNPGRVCSLVAAGRFALIPLALMGSYACYRWSSDLYGRRSGIMALMLWCFCPSMLGYAGVVTADCAATAVGLAANYCFWRWLREPTWQFAVIAGAWLGVAQLTKTTWVILYGLWPILVIAWGVVPKNRSRAVSQLVAMLILAMGIINFGYLFEGSCRPLRDFSFASRPLGLGRPHNAAPVLSNRFQHSCLGRVRLPLPSAYVEGIDLQWHDIEAGKASYLRGKWQENGWWYWYCYALAVKVPLGTWALLFLAVGGRVVGWTICPRPDGRGNGNVRRLTPYRAMWRDELILLAPAMAVLVLVSSQTGFNRYLRYVLPSFPYAFIWISSIAKGVEWRQWKLVVTTLVLLAWSIGSSLWYAPHWMSYFNELAGGPMGGPRHLIDAQVDWGQDLLYLRKWLDAHPNARPLRFAYFGPIDPRIAGVKFMPPAKGTIKTSDRMELACLPDALAPGWYAVSVNHLFGSPYFVHDGQGGREWVDRPYYSYFRRFEPVAAAGYSIYIYHLTEADLKAARSRMQGGDE